MSCNNLMVCEYYRNCEAKRLLTDMKRKIMCNGPANPPINYPYVDDGRIPVFCPSWETKKTLEDKAKPVVKDVLTTRELGIDNQL